MRSHVSVRAVLAATIVLSTVVGGCARAGRREPVDYRRPGGYYEWMAELVEHLGLAPQVQELVQ